MTTATGPEEEAAAIKKYNTLFQITDQFIEGLTGLDVNQIIKTPRKEFLPNFRQRYANELKDWTLNDLERQSRFLDRLFSMIEIMKEITDNAYKGTVNEEFRRCGINLKNVEFYNTNE